MPVVQLTTIINASPEVCFNLSRDIDLHQRSMTGSRERAISGRTSGLIAMGETVTWRAIHFGLPFRLTSKITQFEPYCSFRDEMITGPFRKMKHDHLFNWVDGQTVMTDVFEFEAPFGFIGRLAEKLFLTRYMHQLLVERNTHILAEAEKKVSLQTNL